MSGVHVGFQLAADLVEADPARSRDLVCELLAHLCEHCPDCKAGREGLLLLSLRGPEAEPPKAGAEPIDYRPVVTRAVFAIARVARLMGGQPRTALGKLAAFVDSAPARRWERVRQERQLAEPGLITALLSYGRDAAAEMGESVEDLARLATALIDRLNSDQVPKALIQDLRAEAWALLAREFLAEDSPGTADYALQHAESCLGEGTGDPLAAVHVGLSRALWAWRWGEPGEAMGQLLRLEELAESAGSREDHGELLLWKSLLLRGVGERQEGQRVYESAIGALGEYEAKAKLRRLRRLMERIQRVK